MIVYLNSMREIPDAVDRVLRGEKLQVICGKELYERCLLSALEGILRTDARSEKRGNVLEVSRWSSI